MIATSAGSCVANAYIGEYGNDSLVDACVSISPGYQVEKIFTYPPYSRFYEYAMVKSLKSKVLKPNLDALSKVINIHALNNARTIYDLKKNVYCKTYGYDSMDEYWRNNEPQWCQVDTPRLFINSIDDPICVPELIPFDNFSKYENVILLTTKLGGHCGFVEDLSGFHWTDRVSIEYINAVFSKRI